MSRPPDFLDTQLLATLVAIADTGSFAGAARRIGRTESAVSMQMKRLEDLVGGPPLFLSDGRRRILTERGEVLLAQARKLMDVHEETLLVMQLAAMTGTVRLGAPEDYVGTLLPRALDRFARLHPNVEVAVTCEPSGSLARMIQDRKIDLALVTRGPGMDDAEYLCSEPTVWAASPLHDVHREPTVPLALFQPGCSGRAAVLEAWASCKRPYRIAYSSPSVAGLVTVVRTGLAIAALARCSVPPDLRILGSESGLPALPELPIALLRSTASRDSRSVNALAREIRASLSTGLEVVRRKAKTA
ncbi:LysR substrate-binding domain-containing protein [Chthonobacter rhizosphaerae]|uniref:LysR substrate-binding domain-containing protein n=1 Tax=Chthonobacter rhizosphaerae TaxID=2735553 RepID=UPI0015EF7224|nr:LysR substrate-binding domain-containing protein [Chthonobacter rhizosphaerae]